MPDKQLFQPEKLSMVDYKLIQGHIEAPEDFVNQPEQNYYVESNLDFGFNLGEKLIKADFTVDIKTEGGGKNNEEATGNFHFAFFYKVDNLEELAILEGNTIDVNPALANALGSITYSTSRGILLTRLQGTVLQKFILPVIDPNTLFNKDKKN